MRKLRVFILQKVQASVVERQKISSATHQLALGKEDTLFILEIDHVTQQPKETCQRTCRGPKFTKN